MTDWTDDELGALLTKTFGDHETPDDVEDARDIARSMLIIQRRRLWPAVVAAAAVAAVIAGLATWAAHQSSDSVSTGDVAGLPTGRAAAAAPVPGSHRAVALAEVEHLLDWVDIPGARPLDSPPPAALDQPASSPMTSSPAYQLHRTQFWVVAGASTSDLAHLLTDRTSPIAGATGGTGGGTQPDPQHPGRTITTTTVSWIGDIEHGTPQYVEPELDLVLFQDGSSVDVRADAWISWRPARPAATYVNSDVSSVTVTYRRATSYPDRHPAGTVVVTDRSQVARLVSMVDRLVMTPPGGVFSCPVMRPGTRPPSASMVFGSGDRTWTFADTFGCGSGVGVTTHGARAALDGGDFVKTVWATLAKAR